MYRVPDIRVLVDLYYEILENRKVLSSNVERNEDNNEIRNKMMHECILKLIKFYYLNFPKVITEVKLNVDNLIPMDFQKYQLELQLNMLELLLLIAKSSWKINSGEFLY
jgi:hypothetical protein